MSAGIIPSREWSRDMRVVVATHNRLGQVCIETLHAGGAEVAAVYTRPPVNFAW